MSTLRAVTLRFPQAVLLVLMVSGVLSYLVATESENITLPKLVITGVITFFLSLCSYLFLETRKKKPLDHRFPIVPLVYAVVFFLTVRITHDFSVEGFTYSVLHLVGFVSAVFFAPYLFSLFDGKEETVSYTNYFSRVAWIFLMSAIVGLAVVALWYIAIGSVTTLFNLSDFIWNGKIYGYWAVFSLSLVAPLYGLIHMPVSRDISTKSYETNRFFAFLVKYVAVPAIFIYFLILYAYSAKVLMHFSDWPKGIISWMVIGFSSFWYLTYIFARPYEESQVVSVFRRFFPYAVIPQIAMLAYALSLRLGQYDLTMNRYFVAIFGLWLFIVSLYLIFRARKSLAFIVATLSLFSLVISIGPWSVFSLPLVRQESRLLRNLETAKILQNGKIVPLTKASDISRELSNDIASGINYLCNYDDCERIKVLFPDQVEIAKKKAEQDWKSWNATWASYTGTVSRWEIENAITTDIKVERSYGYEDGKSVETVFYYTNTDSLYPIDTRGYTRVVSINPIDYKNTKSTAYPYVTVDVEKKIVEYHRDTTRVLTFPLVLPKSIIDGTSPRNLSKKELTLDLSGNGLKIELIFDNLSLRNPLDTSTGSVYLGSTSGIALVRE